MTTPVIIAREVAKSFGTGPRRTPILRGANLEVHRGEIIFLVGPSGSGKTTLLTILGCLLSPDAGEVAILGRDVGGLTEKDRTLFRQQNLGFIFQTFNLFPTLSALDNIRLALSMRGISLREAKRRALQLLDQVGLGQRDHLWPAQLSTGECQRVAVARSLAGKPTLLFADEPTASLDAANGQSVMELLRGLVRSQGMTLVVVTHDNRIFPFADRILRMEDGRLQCQWRPAEETPWREGLEPSEAKLQEQTV